MIKPPALKPGDCVGVMAPSSCASKDKLAQSIVCLESHGFKTYVHPQTYQQLRQSAGTPEQKLEALHALFENPDVKAIFAARGGHRAGMMLDSLDLDLIRNNPKILMGFSDVTALLNALYKETGLVGFHGPDMGRFFKSPKEEQIQCLDMLRGNPQPIKLTGAASLSGGTAEGVLIGGNLSLLCSLMGTPWQPDFKDAILFIEDCNDEISRYDRMFIQLKNAGALDQIKGLIVGDFLDTQDTGRPFGFSLKDIVLEHTKGLDIPILMNAPFGHGDRLPTFPIGCRATLESTTLTLLESPTS